MDTTQCDKNSLMEHSCDQNSGHKHVPCRGYFVTISITILKKNVSFFVFFFQKLFLKLLTAVHCILKRPKTNIVSNNLSTHLSYTKFH